MIYQSSIETLLAGPVSKALLYNPGMTSKSRVFATGQVSRIVSNLFIHCEFQLNERNVVIGFFQQHSSLNISLESKMEKELRQTY